MAKAWFVRKSYHCKILGEGCVNNYEYLNRGMDCSDCPIYLAWKKSGLTMQEYALRRYEEERKYNSYGGE